MLAPTTSCPVCSQPDLKETVLFCPVCQWENIQIPDNATDGLRKYYNEKLSVHRGLYTTRRQLEKDIGELRVKIQRMEDEKRPAPEDGKKMEIRIRQLEETIRRLKAELIAIEMGRIRI